MHAHAHASKTRPTAQTRGNKNPFSMRQTSAAGAAWGSIPVPFSSQVLLSKSHHKRSPRQPRRKRRRNREETRSCRPEALCHHRAQGVSVNPFGSERGGYPKGLTKPPWARWWHGASGKRRDVVSAAPAAPAAEWLPRRPFVVGFTQQGLGRNM